VWQEDTEWEIYWDLAPSASTAQICHPFYLPSCKIGSVYSGKDVRNGKQVALKVQHQDGAEFDLYHEYKIYKHLTRCHGIPRAYWYGKEGVYNVLVMDRLETSLHALVKAYPLDLQTVVSYACQMVSANPDIFASSIDGFF